MIPIAAGLYRIDMVAREDATLPREKGTMLRGGFGAALKRTVCAYPAPALRLCADCPLQHSCAFPTLFDGLPPGTTVRPKHDLPRPFVFRTPSDRRTTYHKGDLMAVEFVLIGWARDYLPYVATALSDLAEGGVGRERARFEVAGIYSLDPFGRPPLPLDRGPHTVLPHLVDGPALAQQAAGLPPDHLLVRFVTPTRLLSEHQPLDYPTFPALSAALRRRAEALCRYQCDTHWQPDHDLLDEAAIQVRSLHARVGWRDHTRRSTRSGQQMPMGGFVGSVRYAGPLRPFHELLALGEIVHVGKYAAFGNGQLACGAEPGAAEQHTTSLRTTDVTAPAPAADNTEPTPQPRRHQIP